MSIVYTCDINKVQGEELNRLYHSTHDYVSLFSQSYLTQFVLDDNRLVGAVRVLSEGVETALLVDLSILPEYEDKVQENLISEVEKRLVNRRVMVYSDRRKLDFWERVGYGRCKNAWTYDNGHLTETDFLPSGYRFENEFLLEAVDGGNPVSKSAKRNNKRKIVYCDGYEDTSFEEINELLTRAFWGRTHDLEKTKKAFQNSTYAVTAYDGEKLVGIARAVTDGESYANILNVAVDPEYQGLSIGRQVVLRLSEMIPAERIVLNTHPGAAGFYQRLKEYRRNKYVFEKNITSEEGKEMPPDRRTAMFTPKGYRFPEEYV